MNNYTFIFFSVCFYLLIVALIVMPIAYNYGRNVLGWYILGVLSATIVPLFLLLILGETKERKLKKELEEVERKRMEEIRQRIIKEGKIKNIKQNEKINC